MASRRSSSEARSDAIEALRSRSSVDELLALHEAGAVSSREIVAAVWTFCHDKPAVAAQLIQSLLEHPREAARGIGDDIQNLLQARAGRRT